MEVKADRLSFFQNWLRRNFAVNATLDRDGVLALESWIQNYGGGLISNVETSREIFEHYNPHWSGKYSGYNVIVDIAIYLGEYLIYKRPRLFWSINKGELNEEGKVIGNNLYRPIITGFPNASLWRTNVFRHATAFVARSRDRANIFRDRYVVPGDPLTYHLKHALHLAQLPEGDYVYVVGDYSNEPL